MSNACIFTDNEGNDLKVSVYPAKEGLPGSVSFQIHCCDNNIVGARLCLEQVASVMMVLRGMNEKYVCGWQNSSFIFSHLYNGSGSVYRIEINQFAYSLSYSQAFVLMLGLEKCLPALMFGI